MQTNSTKFPDLQKFIGKIFNTQENNFPQVVDISEISWYHMEGKLDCLQKKRPEQWNISKFYLI